MSSIDAKTRSDLVATQAHVYPEEKYNEQQMENGDGAHKMLKPPTRMFTAEEEAKLYRKVCLIEHS